MREHFPLLRCTIEEASDKLEAIFDTAPEAYEMSGGRLEFRIPGSSDKIRLSHLKYSKFETTTDNAVRIARPAGSPALFVKSIRRTVSDLYVLRQKVLQVLSDDLWIHPATGLLLPPEFSPRQGRISDAHIEGFMHLVFGNADLPPDACRRWARATLRELRSWVPSRAWHE